MIDQNQLRSQLQTFGFSEKEVSVYLTLVKRGKANPRSIATAADISTSYVYEVCERLADRGLVIVEDHRSPTLVQARSPSVAFEELTEQLEDIEKAVEQRYHRPADTDSVLNVVQSRATLVNRLQTLISDAESEILLLLPESFLGEIHEDLENAVDRGVFVLLVLSGQPSEIRTGALEDIAVVARETLSSHVPVYLAIDQKKGTIAPPSLLSWEHGNGEAIEFTHQTIISTIIGSFFSIWQASEPLLYRFPNQLPQRYEAIRPAVYDAYLTRSRGASVRIKAKVRPTETYEPTQLIEGNIVDIRQSLLDPIEGNFAVENTLVVETKDNRISVGGKGAFIEDYELSSLVLSIK